MKPLISLMAATCLVGTVIAQQPSPPPTPAPELRDWEVWVGDWTMVGTAKDSPTEPEYKLEWRLHGRWILGGFFVQVDHIWKGKGVEQHCLEILSYDPIKKIHALSGFASDGSTWVATATFTDGTCLMNGTTTTPDGRVMKWSHTWVLSADRMSVSGTQKSEQDGVRWTSSTVKGSKAKAAPAADLAAEQEAIRALFERHRLAIESKNLAGVSQTFDHTGPLVVAVGEGEPMTDWPSVERVYRDWFAAADEIHMKDTCVQVRVHPSGLAAWATYLTDEAETAKGTSRTEHLRATFGLEKHGPAWVVVQAHWSVPLGATSAADASAQSQIDRIAESYVRLVLAVGQYDSEYVDSYFGPPEWQEQAAAKKTPLGDIRPQVVHAREELAAIGPSGFGEMDKLRLRYLGKQLGSVKTRIDMLAGVKMKFDTESAALFDAVAPDYPDAHFEAQLARADALLPGAGTLRERYEKFRQRLLVPKEKVEPVFRAAMQEARLRTRRYIQLLEGENLRIEFVSGKPWTAYSRCQGNGQSVMQLNTDQAFLVDELLYLACHEGYPGHHVTFVLLEDRLVRKRGWREFSVVPLHSPLSVVMEGTADEALDLAFPIAERIAFERDTLYPLAGLDPALADIAAPVYDVTRSLSDLSDARPVAARRYLDGSMGRSEMLEWLKARTLVPRDQLEILSQFISHYRSYILCYTVGLDLVKRQIEKEAGADREKQWQAFEHLQTPPRPPSDLR